HAPCQAVAPPGRLGLDWILQTGSGVQADARPPTRVHGARPLRPPGLEPAVRLRPTRRTPSCPTVGPAFAAEPLAFPRRSSRAYRIDSQPRQRQGSAQLPEEASSALTSV